jgi:hypothetical protein
MKKDISEILQIIKYPDPQKRYSAAKDFKYWGS